MTDELAQSSETDWRYLLLSFRGRISRRVFVTRLLLANLVLGLLFAFVLFGVFQGVELSRASPGGSLLTVVASLFLVVLVALSGWINLSMTIKRLHDRDRSGWFYLLLLIPLINFWILLEIYFFRGKADANKYGTPSRFKTESLTVVIGLGITALLLGTYAWPPIVRSLVVQSFNLPSGSQEPTMLVGDYFLVSKSAYGYSRYSFPYGVIPISGRIFGVGPKLGDVAVFKFPGDNSTDYVKRVVGLPGDRIQMKDGVLYINNEAVPKVRVADYVEDFQGIQHHVPQFRETLPNGVNYYVLDREPQGELDNTQVFVVPENHYFMMGDNRDNSADSRTNVGYVPFENFVGKAEFLFYSTNGTTRLWQIWKWGSDARFERIGKLIQ